MARKPSPRPWWWLAQHAGVTDSWELLDCPWCGGPAETVPWHPDSSVRANPGPESSAAAEIAFTRANCMFGHWFLTPVPADEGSAAEHAVRTESWAAGHRASFTPPGQSCAERGRR